ncbi:hypothetical protein F4861DRAFT_293425 [Xylaria intraflava]|nr:hypothetical protein F4861DRAFT_293425 [Xylaria intraflava]
MPLSPVSPNVKLSQVAAEKGSHEFVDANAAVDPVYHASIDTLEGENIHAQKLAMSASTMECQPQLPIVPVTGMRSTPPESSPAPPTEAGSGTPAENLLLPNVTSSEAISAHSAQQINTNLPAPTHEKKRKATAEEKERERAEKKRKQDDAAAAKAKSAAEREAIKATKAMKADEKAAEKEAKKLKKLEDERATEAAAKKQRNLMANFLGKTPTTLSRKSDHSTITTAKADTATLSESNQGAKPAKSAYELNFNSFFVKSDVTVAASPFEMDDETKELKSSILDEYMRGDRGEFKPKHPFNAVEAFDFLVAPRRGIISPSVRKIMEGIHGNSLQATFKTPVSKSESQTDTFFINAQNQINAIPMKYLQFHEDVRPAYFGTVTTPMARSELRTLSRRPTGRLLPLSYDYDSEAEWVEEDGEDLDDAEDDEEDIDGDEEMDDFVDDSEAVATITRPGFEADSLPISTGLCFEDQTRLGPSPIMRTYQLEFLMDSLVHSSVIDPFSAEYWPVSIKKVTATTSTTSSTQRLAASTLPSVPRDAVLPKVTAVATDGKDGVPLDILEDFKRALLSEECRDFSKATVIELLAKKFTSCTKLQVKVTLDTIAHRVTPPGEKKKSVKQWALLPDPNPN